MLGRVRCESLLSVVPLVLVSMVALKAAAGSPDLVVRSVSPPPAAAAPGGAFQVTTVVRNAGRTRARPSVVSYHLSRDRRLGRGDVRLSARRSLKAIAPGRSSSGRTRLRIPASVPAGSYHLIACADGARRLRERKEGNNCRAAARKVRIARGAAPQPPAPQPPAPGGGGTPGGGDPGGGNPGGGDPGGGDPGGGDPGGEPGGGTPAPDPETTAPPVDQTAATSMADATAFLYTGSNPTQTGVAAGTIDEERVAVLRGSVTTRAGNPLPGVEITVLDHPELGRTRTQADGEFDMAVNGGGLLTLRYELDGYMPAQRQVEAPWQDYAQVEGVVLVPYDSRATQIDLTSPEPIQTARGTPVTDGDGTRQATVMFPQGTEATMVMPNGQEQPLTDLSVRATEYTAGPAGPEAMPGELPATSAYTYAAELSVDAAVSAGAAEVRFSEPVLNYTENFLGFPTGTPVPTGYYDREQGRWVAAPDGRVIEIVGETGGTADVDTSGDGLAEGPMELAQLGITDAERAELASLYAPGDSLWRVPMRHFTPWDHNWPYGPPDDAIAPGDELPEPGADRPKPKKECYGDGSVIACHTQRLGERLPLVGVPFTLDYWSDRAPGRSEERSIDIPLSGPSIPASLDSIELEVTVAGRTFRQTFPAAPNLRHAFTWDGRDAYGRTLQGAHPVTVRVGYVYPVVYRSPAPSPDGPSDFQRSFGRFSRAGTAITGSEARRKVTIWTEWRDEAEATLGSWDARAQGLGGWTLAVHHAYDPQRRVVHLGDGRSIDADPVITTLAGNGQAGDGNGGNGGPATGAALDSAFDVVQAPDGAIYFTEVHTNSGNGISPPGWVRRIDPDGTLTTIGGNGSLAIGEPLPERVPATQSRMTPRGLALGPDGSLYFTDSTHGLVRRIDRNGIVETVAGGYGGRQGISTQDNIPATDLALLEPTDVAVGPDGSVFVADAERSVVYRVGTDGRSERYAGGNGEFGPLGDGGPATSAVVRQPGGLAVGPEGNLYIAENGGGSSTSDPTDRVRMVTPDGEISTVAGGATRASATGDGHPAVQEALFRPRGLSIAPDGALLIVETHVVEPGHSPFDPRSGGAVRRVGTDGVISTIAGGARKADGPGDRGPAPRAHLGRPEGVFAAPDGSVLIADTAQNPDTFAPRAGKVRRVARPFPVSAGGEITVPSRDGTELYRFSPGGRHLRTLDALTGDLVLEFGYDGAGRLTSVTDAGGRATTVERSPAGAPTAIVAPGGQRTTLALDGNGWLSRVTNPAGDPTSLTYHAGGLLATLTEPRGGVHSFGYDALGRLVRDEDADGVVQTLARTRLERGYRVTLTSELGRTATFEVERRLEGGMRIQTTRPGGATTTVVSHPDGRQVATYPGGSTTETQTVPDPRWDFAVPLLASMVHSTPGGRTETVTRTRSVSLANPDDPLSLTALTDTLTRNGRTYTRAYDASARTLTDTSAEGRRSVTTFDAEGRIQRFEPDGGLDPVTFQHDARGLVTSATQGDQRWTFTYDPRRRVATRTDALGRVTRFEYDDADRVVRLIRPSGDDVRFAYDANGNRTGVTLPVTPRHDLGYTPGDRLSSYTPAGSATALTRTYDADGDLASRTLPGGARTEHAYDAAGRPEAERFGAAAATFSYADATDRVTGIERSPGGGGTAQGLALAYDGDLPTRSEHSGTAAGTFEWSWDGNAFLTNVRLTSGSTTLDTPLTRDDDGLVTGYGPFQLDRSGPGGAPVAVADSALAMNLAYDGLGRLAAKDQDVAGNTSVYRSELTRDAAGRIVTKVETVAGTTSTYEYGYDPDGRLVGVERDGIAVESYAYNANGNRTSSAAAYNPQDQLELLGGVDYEFSDDGFLSRRGADTFTYSARGELLEATVGGTTVAYDYDGLGRRVARRQGGQTTEYLYGNPGNPFEVTAVRTPDGTLTQYYYDDAGLLFAMERGGTRYYVATDQVGTPRVVTDASGNVVRTLSFDSFGVPGPATGTGPELPFGFAGGLADPVTGLVRFGLRDYDPAAGRWTARDPALYGGGQANLYVYAGNDPVNQRDPTGLFCIGGSIYSGVGGGAQLCITDEGFSVCAELGLGFGTDADVDITGDLAESGESVVAEAKAKFGPIEGKIGAELDDTGCLSGDLEFGFGPAKLGLDGPAVKFDVPVEVDGRDWLVKAGKNGRASVQAKVAAKLCRQF